MRRRASAPGWHPSLFLIVVSMVLVLCPLVYLGVLRAFRRPEDSSFQFPAYEEPGCRNEDCCNGKDQLELWGPVVKWGDDHKFHSTSECCRACKAMCSGDGPCLCNSWVFCGDRVLCGQRFGECWLKKQEDALFPSLNEGGNQRMWTSGLIYGKGQGIIGTETKYGILRIKLFPDRAPHSVAYILDILATDRCYDCYIYRAEGRGDSWDSYGNHISNASFGPPYALIQGKLGGGRDFSEVNLPAEACPKVRRGSVGWVDSSSQFFISLANHNEWRKAYTIFGTVLPEDMYIAEKIAALKTRSDVWSNINVSVLEETTLLKLKPIRNVVPNKSEMHTQLLLLFRALGPMISHGDLLHIVTLEIEKD